MDEDFINEHYKVRGYKGYISFVVENMDEFQERFKQIEEKEDVIKKYRYKRDVR